MSNLQAKIQKWLEPLDTLKVECDGMTRVIDWLMWREKIPSRIVIGALTDQTGAKIIPLHYWLEVMDEESGEILTVDMRARMWAGEQANHGVFIRSESDPVQYEVKARLSDSMTLTAEIIHACFGIKISEYPHLNGGQSA